MRRSKNFTTPPTKQNRQDGLLDFRDPPLAIAGIAMPWPLLTLTRQDSGPKGQD
jgi:hypothetical protein